MSVNKKYWNGKKVIYFASAIAILFSLANQTNAQTSTTTTAPLQGNVKGTMMPAETALKELEESYKHIKEAAQGTVYETMREPMVTVGGPNVIGSIVIPAIPAPTGSLSVGEVLPPRKKALNYYLYKVYQALPVVSNIAEGSWIPAKDMTQADIDQIQKGTLEILQGYRALYDVCNVKKPDNMKVGMAGEALNETSEKLGKEMKKYLKETEEDDKTVEKEKKDH
jgi:hypothetical protein